MLKGKLYEDDTINNKYILQVFNVELFKRF